MYFLALSFKPAQMIKRLGKLYVLLFPSLLIGAMPAASSLARLVAEARDSYYSAQKLPDASETEKRKRFEQGLAAADSARKESPDDPGAVLWWTANEGALAELKKNLWSLGAIKDIEKELKWLGETHPDYGYGAADRVLGKIYLEVPRLVSIGSTAKAEERLRRAVKHHPEFPGNWLGLAEVLLRDGKKEDARDIARTVASAKSYRTGDFGDFSRDRDGWKKTVDRLMNGEKQP